MPRSSDTQAADPAPSPTPSGPWYALSVEEVEEALGADGRGLSGPAGSERLLRYGHNEVEAEPETPWWALLAHQFTDPLIYILLVAAGVTLVLRDFTDTGVILAVVPLNAVIGFIQEAKARQAMRALARMTAPAAEVVRDGSRQTIPSRDLVPGDVVVLTSGARGFLRTCGWSPSGISPPTSLPSRASRSRCGSAPTP